MRPPAAIANRLWLASQAAERRRFLAACSDPASAQAGKLAGYLRRQAGTAFGREHGFARLRDLRAYARAVPLRDWDGFRPWVERIARGEAGVLTADPVDRLEPTSGTTAGAKFIPVTRELRSEIGAAAAAWMPSLRRTAPDAFAGRAYWAVSPALMRPQEWPGSRVRVGHARDSEYLSPLSAFLLRRILAVPEGFAATAPDGSGFFRATALRLLACADLSFVSVWSPAFLLRLDDTLRAGEDWPGLLAGTRSCGRRRIRFLESALGKAWTWRDLWPGLAAASCWTHAQAGLFSARTRTALGEVYLEPKGLMATEGATTVPVERGLDPVLSLRSHFFEFLPDDGGEAVGAESLRIGMRCETVLTTGGGLYRYRTGDLVEVTGMFRRAPALRFLGRTGRVSDLAGEKVSEAQANRALAAAGAVGLDARVAFLWPQADEAGALRYRLMALPGPDTRAPAGLERAAAAVEDALCENPYYRQARALGQLAPVAVLVLDAGFPDRWAALGPGSARQSVAKIPALFPAGLPAGLIAEPCPAT